MTDILLPTWLKIARVAFRYGDSTGVSVGEFSGFPTTGAKGGDRLTASLDFSPTSSTQSTVERAALISFLARLRGRQNRAYLYNPAQRRRGSFPATELLVNPTFADGTAGWDSFTEVTRSASDRIYRATRNAVTATQSFLNQLISPTVTQYAPYAWRVSVRGLNYAGVQLALDIQNNAASVTYAQSPLFTTQGLVTLAVVSPDTILRPRFIDAAIAGLLAGKFVEVNYTSFARCALVDNGPNALLRSDEIDNAAWTSFGLGSVTANARAAPDGTTTAELLNQDTSGGGHYRFQNYTVPSAAADFAASCAFQSSNRSWAFLVIEEQAGGQGASAHFNLSSGTIGTVTSTANVANARAFVVPKGNGWFECHLVARKTNAATTLQVRLAAATADNVFTYTGAAEGAIYVWRGGSAPSSVPTRGARTTTAATTGTAQTGSALHLKGLPASTNGLLREDDEVEVITSHGSELKIVTAALNSDAAGLGYLQCEPPLRGTPADNAPVIIHQPMGRFLFMGDLVGWDNEPGIITRASAEFEEA